MKLKIQVTEQDIASGIRSNPHSCPIAQACSRLGYLPDACPDTISLRCLKTREWYTSKTPQVAYEFMGKFDSYKPVAPFEFEIEVLTAEERAKGTQLT